MSKNFPKLEQIDEGQNGPADGGWSKIVDGEEILEMDSRDGESEPEETEADRILTNAENATEKPLNVFSEDHGKIIDSEGTEGKIIGQILPLELEIDELDSLPEGVLKDAAGDIAKATSIGDLDRDDIDSYEQYIYEMEDYNKELATKLRNHFEKLQLLAEEQANVGA